jgi:hypothetical protein
MLTFRDRFHGADDFECIIHADKPPKEHRRFKIAKPVLEMWGTPSIVPENNIAICDANREKILAACEVAHNEQPSAEVVVLQPHHFLKTPFDSGTQKGQGE